MMITITDFLTLEELERAAALWKELRDTGRFEATVAREIIVPNKLRIKTVLGEKYNSASDRDEEGGCP